MSQLFTIRWPKYWSFSDSISSSNEYSELIFFRIDWFDLFAVQGTLKSLFQHHSSKASILQCSAFFMVLLSHPYVDWPEVNNCWSWALRSCSCIFSICLKFSSLPFFEDAVCFARIGFSSIYCSLDDPG